MHIQNNLFNFDRLRYFILNNMSKCITGSIVLPNINKCECTCNLRPTPKIGQQYHVWLGRSYKGKAIWQENKGFGFGFIRTTVTCGPTRSSTERTALFVDRWEEITNND